MSYTSLFYHIVFSTKDRRPTLSAELLPRTCQYLGGIARNLEGQVLLGGGTPDHVHLAAVVPPTVTVADFIGKLKANTTGWIHKTVEGIGAFAWQDGYAAFTVSPSVLPQVKKYIAAQAEHHKTLTFEEELVALLEKHGIEYDARYITA